MPEAPKLMLAPRHVLNNGAKGARLAAAGRGDERSIVAEAARMFALTPPNDPGPRVVTSVADVTAGLGLEATIATRIQNAVSQSNVRFDKRGGTAPAPIARAALIQVLRSDDVPFGARNEIMVRADSWWKNTARTGYGAPTGANACTKSLTIAVPVLVLEAKP